MDNTGKKLIGFILTLAFFSIFSGQIDSQKKAKTTAGFGNPDAFNVGL